MPHLQVASARHYLLSALTRRIALHTMLRVRTSVGMELGYLAPFASS
jgi:hypothetical protein